MDDHAGAVVTDGSAELLSADRSAGDDPCRTAIDGIPVFWAPAPGPLKAALSFRVGHADETYPLKGITHLIEHVALSTLGQQPYEYNGVVTQTHTGFYASGTADEVVSFVRAVCAALSSLPTDRLAHEKSILRAEAGGRGETPFDSLLTARFGPQAFGLAGYPEELSLDWVDAEEVREWSSRYFTAQNAVLTLSGEPPAGLSLSLPAGSRMPTPPAVGTIRMTMPAWYSADVAGVGFSIMGERSPALSAFSELLAERLEQRVRHDTPLSYGVMTDFDRLDARTALVTTFADALPENTEQLRDVLLETIEASIETPPETEQLDRYKQRALRSLDQEEDSAFATAMVWSWEELTGGELRTRAQLRRALAGLTVTSVRDAGRAAFESALFLVPEGLGLPEPRYHEQPLTKEPVRGMQYACRYNGSRLTVADDGLTIAFASGGMATVRFAEVVAVLATRDGARRPVDDQGFSLLYHPEVWVDPPDVSAHIDSSVPAGTVVFVGDKTELGGPSPDEAAYVANHSGTSKWVIASFVVGAILVLVALGMIVAPKPGSNDRSFGLYLALVAGVPTVLGTLRIWRQRGAQRPRPSA